MFLGAQNAHGVRGAAYSRIYTVKKAGNEHSEQHSELSAHLSYGYQYVVLIVCNKKMNLVFACVQCALDYRTAYNIVYIWKQAGNAYL